ncbi:MULTISPECIES: PTS mannose/fructose/sorbose/N-acetylgalactosamine transporter subunit IIC [Clostridium]|uniref:PTS mannose transporter subunit IICD n=2 Tax=Clostridium TaxID=1485 RepID=A0A1S8SS87_CLOBE|nr:PTS sugar transporter subunit IIC [Clostridium beijerinckii]MBA8936544.1 PTS system mannose-specific IIC component/fructoselysine and glucoselysine-specific PTS system IIC component [Clostridium beijerinckii]MZK52181.1 PTS mannose transporter subunit IICD [Clostridium beijerinckii]MZK60021.1 PTS mannose transporter subunit IICD [Clostridium beijerinckii]MZK70561.1 PTS mannose transporter subunit IICD [Clostridium beijerinckii]MZK75539.1 PTS mannose transporter subunit IICD [Clostridium beij
MIAQAIMLGLLAGIGILDGRIFGQIMLERPIITGALVGLILGDLKTGIIIGAQLELIWMGIAGIGAATPPDVVTGGVLGTAFAILSGNGVEVALALAVPIAVLAQSLGVLVRIVNSYFAQKASIYAKKADFRGIAIMMWIPVLLFFLSTFIPTFLAIMLGANAVTALINSIPKIILEGLGIAGSLLPAVGFALLMDMLLSKKMAVFFFIGFLLASYAKLDITAIALFGACVAFILNIYINTKENNTVKQAVANNLTEGEIDFE